MTLTYGIKESFAYERRSEGGTQPPLTTLKLGRGSCRDFALLMMEAVRCLGFAARFVSGYLYVPDRDEATYLGGGSTHAWCQVYLPGAGWVEFDPTNGIVGNRDLIRVAVARDPAQAVPLAGTFFGDAADELGMTVEVQVTTLQNGRDEPTIAAMRPRPDVEAQAPMRIQCRLRDRLRLPAADADAAHAAASTRRGRRTSSAPERIAFDPPIAGDRVPRRLRQRLHPHRRAAGPAHDLDRFRRPRPRHARSSSCRRPSSTRVEDLPDDVLVFLLGSRYCDTDRLSEHGLVAVRRHRRRAGRGCRRSATTSTTASRFGYQHAELDPHRLGRPSTSGRGVCRDFAHLAITFCRCMNIPARYCTGYLGDIGVPPVPDADGLQRLVRGLPRRPLVHASTPATTRRASAAS